MIRHWKADKASATVFGILKGVEPGKNQFAYFLKPKLHIFLP